ncbi:MAG TPA: hypothetical protein VH120_12795, partial [Gemmataceae bacterium]|nr:hypothetical protein [Gemmataceae bacterium]
PLGAYRTLARLPEGEPFTYTAWINAVRSGRTVVSAGAAAVSLDVSGVTTGGELRHSGPLRAIAAVHSLEPADRLELVVNGTTAATAGGATIDHEFSVPDGGWAAVRCWAGGRLLAHTSPVYLSPQNGRPFAGPAGIKFLCGHLSRAREWVDSEGRFTKPKSRDHLLGIFDAAREALLARAVVSGTIHDS